MKTLIIYTSQTGFTKKYAEWISARLDADMLTIQEAKKKTADFFNGYDSLIYGGWLMAGSVVNAKWFLQKADSWKNKKLAVFCVGASKPDSSDAKTCLEKLLNDEQKTYIKAFYLQGGLDYSKMNAPSKMAVKALASMLSKKKDATPEMKEMAEIISHSCDYSDEKYVEPIVNHMRE